ncbi:peptidase M27 [Clostridium baratii]|uniref:non-toxic nonhemagglutinin NTNH n=1 Tax=Clostridium baratii TaxID=1561 RepID=UPI0009A3C524|nr:non-toxic nonhemagglutinin NTNH [Clostridium baratii]OPF52039.1 peptidase M27 [Clostridium baratii]OPF54676.1 peptidase M27 [Clostridium baratii]OPF54690.1 peptidase M27 [Clostridium baratii]OPF60937.1 peptidase M27 [Clostridium baratii]
MKINNNFNIDSPVDNKNVAVVRGRKTDSFFKAFQVAPNIWIAPERYYGESLNINEDQKSDGGIYDSNFLSTDDEKDEFLQATIKILQRINNNIVGEKLLSLIATAMPFPYEYGAEDFRQTNYLSSKDNKYYYPANLVIFGPGSNLIENSVVCYKKEYSENGMGTMCEVWFQPFLTYKYDQFYNDPALELIKCLIKSLYYLYGIKPSDDLSIPYRLRSEFNYLEYSELDIIDFLISGGNDYKFLNTNPYWLTSDYFINASKNFEKYKNYYETKVKNNNDISNSIKLYLEQKFKTNVQDIWELNLSYFSKEFQIMMPERYNNALNHYYKKEYYMIDYFKNYNISGFVNGQINTRLPLSKYNKDIISKPELIVNLINENNTILMKSNIYGDGLKDTRTNFYSNYKIPYSTNYEYQINHSYLNNVNIEEISNIPPIDDKDIYPYRKNADSFIPVYSIASTKEITTTTPLPINYLQAQMTNNNNIKLSLDFLEVISSKGSLVYSFLNNTIDYLDSIKYDKPINTAERYYEWLKSIFRNYSFDITETQEINTSCGTTKVVPWIGKALNILNTNNSFVEEFEKLGPISLINKKENITMPKIEIDEIPNSMLNLSFNDLSNNLFNIYAKNNSYFKKIYYNFLDQWWTQYYSQYFYLICMGKKSVLAQEKLIKEIIQKQLNYLIRNSNISSSDLALMNLTTTNTLRDISNKSQIAMNNIDDFFNNAAICVFQSNIYPKFISFMQQCINGINENTKYFIQKCTNVTEDEKLQLIMQNSLNSLNFDFLDIEKIKCLFNSYTRLLIKEQSSPYELSLYAFQGEDKNVIGDGSGKNTLVEYTNDIGLIYGINNNALYLNQSNQSVSFTNDYFENGLTNSFSIYFWLRNLGKDIIKSKLISSKLDNCGWEIYLEDNGLVFNIIDSNGSYKKIYISDMNNSWNYITISVDRLKEQLLIFVNDVLVANEDIKDILNIYSSNTISLVSENNQICIEGLSILNTNITKEEVLNNYFADLNNSYIRNGNEERLEYNKKYNLFNYVFSKTPICKVNHNNKIYLSINNDDNLNVKPLSFMLLSVDSNKKYVQKCDEVIISILDDKERYLCKSNEDNRIEIVDNKSSANIFIINNDIFISNCLTLKFNNKFIYLSEKYMNYNWIECENKYTIPKKAYLWILKNI